VEVVPKKWGRELIVCNNELYAGKILEVDRGAISSLHRHLRKDETFWCLNGIIRLEVGGESHFLTCEHEPVRVRAGIWHRFEGLEWGRLLEVSTPHSDDDVERLTQSQSAEERRGLPRRV